MRTFAQKFNRYWVRLAEGIIVLAVVYEGLAVFLEYTGHPTFPTFSRLLVDRIPLWCLELLTVVVALFLMIHWILVKRGNS